MPKKINTNQEINVVQDPEKEVPADILAESIVKISSAMQALTKTRLKEQTIVTLIHVNSGISRRDIRLVIHNLTNLEQIWLNPKKK